MVPQIEKISKGWPLILGGLILLFYALGILNWRLVLVLISFYLIFIGVYQMGGIDKVLIIFKKKQ